MLVMIFKILISMGLAFLMGKLVSKLKLPEILGWLIAGMILGPHALGTMNNAILEAEWYKTTMSVFECVVGLMIGTELVWNRIKKSGKSIIITTLTQSIGTFLLVTIVFSIVFAVTGLPIYLAFIFGGIALATAPAPALSIVKEFRTDGPVTRTLIPMAALDDIVGVIIFFSVMAVVSTNMSGQSFHIWMIAVIVLLPLLIGAMVGIPTGFLLKKSKSKKTTITLMIVSILLTSYIGYLFNTMVMPKPILNFMLMGMAFSAAFSNIVPEEKLNEILNDFNPILSFCMIAVILNLGAPLDFHLIFGAGIFTLVYIVSRALGKYFGANFGARMTKSPETVQKYLGFTLLPHSGVSLIFTGIAVTALSASAPESAQIIQGTIAAAAVINEIIAVIMAKKGFEWAGEFNKLSSWEE
ncbi:MAG: cation:proton antiporter [Peptostreptococcus sp.]|uniref:cation:proton antiporter n=1 Tax=Peptostreptococcus sp. TaxID=1262 RepID=UPI002FCA42D8